MENHVFTGVFIPAKIWINPNICPTEKLILGEIDVLSRNSGWCFAKNAHFAKWLGCKPNNVSNFLTKMASEGKIVLKYSNDKTHEGRKMKVNLQWYHGLPEYKPGETKDAKRPHTQDVPPHTQDVPPHTQDVPPHTQDVTEREFKLTSKHTKRGDTPTPQTSTSKQKPKSVEVAPPGENPETVKAEKEKAPPVAPPPPYDREELHDKFGTGNPEISEFRHNLWKAVADQHAPPTHIVTETDPSNPNLKIVTGLRVSEPTTKTVTFPQNTPGSPGQPPAPKPQKKAAPSAPAPHEENQEVFGYFDNAEKIGAAWRKWITEKWGQHRCKFKTVESEKIALRQLWTLSSGKSDLAEQIIDQSIANTWKGLFALKIQNNGTKPTIADRRKQATANMLRHVAEFGLG